MTTKTGMRVVRGPDWTHGNDDGGEGYLGTVVGIPGRGPSHGKVHVAWDHLAQEKTYFAGKDDKFEIRIFDIGPTGVKHEGVTCDACRKDGVTGIRWKCAVCTDYDLCSECYHNDRHDRGHSFMRYVTDNCKLSKVPPRNASTRKELYGLVKGAEVSRGLHWNFGNQDGGAGRRGKIVEVGTFSGGSYRGGVRVRWDHKPDAMMGYKVGAEGKVDLVAKSKTSGGTYYPDHLPRLDVVNPDHVHLKKGDKVKVDIDMDTFKKLQKENSSGWNDAMVQCMKETGTIVAIPQSSVIRVQYEDARMWSVVRSVLSRVGAEGKVDLVAKSKTSGGTYYPDHLPRLDVVNPDHVHLKKGDKVKVDIDMDTFKKLQKENSSGWNDAMVQCMKETGTIVAIPQSSVIRVQYEDARMWSVVRSVLSRVSHFNKGDLVQILDSYNAAVELQVGHGGWNDRMEDILGKIGCVVDIDSDGDLRVEVGGYRWLMSPVSCTLIHDPNRKPQPQDNSTKKESPADPPKTSSTRVIMNVPELLTFTADNQVSEFFQAAEQGDLAKVKSFVASNKGKINTRVRGNTALHVACYHGHVDIVNHLLDNGVDKNVADDDGETPLFYAVDGEQPAILDVMCKKGANKNGKNKEGLTALQKAVNQDALACVQILIRNGADINTQDKDLDTPMHDAIKLGSKDITRALLECDQLDGSKANKEKLNVMHVAVINAQQRVVEVLIGRNKNLATTAGGQDNWSPLHLAAMNGRTAIAGVLVKKGEANVNAVDKNKRTPLHYAVQSCENTIIDLLLGRDANTNLQDVDGNTPAHLAQMAKLPTAGRKRKEEEEVQVQSILCMLAECGADLKIKNKAGKTPLDLCKTPELVSKLTGIAARVAQEAHKVDDIPPHWTSMAGRELLVQDLLSDDALTAEEYNNVSAKFLRTMANVEIISIKRIQNRSLWDAYNVQKRSMERRYGLGCANELNLFHGTPANSVEPIQHQNIDPLLAGNNVGAIWGKGAYFAVDAKQSDNYASASDEGYRFMFVTRVLAGRCAQGTKGMQRPPPMDPSNPNELADTVVDNPQTPRIYVVFRNQQIYPEFLVQYL